MSKFKEQELIQALKSTGATKQNPATVKEIHYKLDALDFESGKGKSPVTGTRKKLWKMCRGNFQDF